MKNKAANMDRCDELLARAENLERDLRLLASDMPPGVANVTSFISKTADFQQVVITRLNTAYNSIRRYQHG